MSTSGLTRKWTGRILSAIAVLSLISGCVRPPAGRPSVAAATADQDVYQGIPAGFTEEGHPYLGEPEAPVTLEEYSDYLCPFCARHQEQTMSALMERYVSTGQVRYVFRDMPLVSLHPTSPVGHAAALCVGEQGAALYWAMHDALFRAQSQWNSLPDPTGVLAEIAGDVGADSRAYEACMAEGRHEDEIERGVAAGQALGFNGTPSFQFIHQESGESYTLVGAYPIDTFAQWLDALGAGEAPPQEEEAEAEPPELPYWANAEGLAPDPERPGYTMAGDAYKGSPGAEVVVVEFSDFQCPACRRHALETQPVLDETFVKTGEIMWVFKPLPLKEHPQAIPAAVAAECAGEQGRFWEMHHRLYEELDAWAVEDADARLLSLAKEEGLEMDAFSACFSGRGALERVVGDLYDAQGIVETTPSFVVLQGNRGTLVTGSRPIDQFERMIRSRLEGDGGND